MSSVRLKVIAAVTVGLITAAGAVPAFAASAVPNWGGPPPPPPPPPPPRAIAASSTGKAMNVVVNVSGQVSSLLNQVMASDNKITAYNERTSLPTYTKTTAFKGGLTLTGNARTLTSIASATSTTASGQRTANASAAIGSLGLTIKNGTATLMTLTGTRLSSKSAFLATTTGVRRPSGGTSIGGVTINSAAFGAKNVKFSGTPTANKVLFHTLDGTVVIYANRQTTTKAANGKPASIKVNAISVQLTKFKNAGKTITGNLEIATSIAN